MFGRRCPEQDEETDQGRRAVLSSVLSEGM